MTRNPILATDSYKASHWLQYPPGTSRVFSYIESRGCEPPHEGFPPFNRLVWFGLQVFLDTFMAQRVTDDDVAEAASFFKAHGEPFNADGWRSIVRGHGGNYPVQIRALPEGTVAPLRTPLLTIENTDPAAFWLPSYLETALLRACWYPTTVATISWHAKRVILGYLRQTADDPENEIAFKLHDFGARGVSSGESAALGGAARLVNFKGSDTVEGVFCANRHYDCPMSAFSIPAAEHSTICAWERENEAGAYGNMLAQFAKPGALVAVVSDSYDIMGAVSQLWCGSLLPQVRASGATVVIRPDSGNPASTVRDILELMSARLPPGEVRVNRKGYRVLPSYFRIIQGDGMNLASIQQLLRTITEAGFCASNVAFGMGGKLLQVCNRDTLKFAMKASWVEVDGVGRDVWKEPVGDTSKASKRGRVDTKIVGEVDGICAGHESGSALSALQTVYRDGARFNRTTLNEVRARAGASQ